MAIRVDRSGIQGILDPVGAGATGGGVPIYDDGVTRPWVDRPWGGKENFMSSDAMALARVPAEQIAAIRPSVPQQLFPQEFGYDDTPLTVEAVLDTNRWTPQIRSWVSARTPEKAEADGGGGGYQGSPHPAMSSSPFG